MDQLVINVLGGLIVLILGAWLGIGSKSERVVFATNSKKKWWKKFIIFAWLLIVLGLIFYGQNAPVSGNPFDPHMNGWGIWGVDFIGIGLILLIIGKIFLWLNS